VKHIFARIASDRTCSLSFLRYPVYRDRSLATLALSNRIVIEATNSANFGWLTRRAYAATTKDSEARQVRFLMTNPSARHSATSFSDRFPMHSRRDAPHHVDTGTDSELSSDRDMRLAARYGTSLVRKMFPQ